MPQKHEHHQNPCVLNRAGLSDKPGFLFETKSSKRLLLCKNKPLDVRHHSVRASSFDEVFAEKRRRRQAYGRGVAERKADGYRSDCWPAAKRRRIAACQHQTHGRKGASNRALRSLIRVSLRRRRVTRGKLQCECR